MRIITLFMAAALLAGCGESEVERAEEAVRRELYDPDSAVFRDVQASLSTKYQGMVFVCGEVNAKNLVGGMAGFRRFVYTPDVHVLDMEPVKPGPELKAFEETWGRECSR